MSDLYPYDFMGEPVYECDECLEYYEGTELLDDGRCPQGHEVEEAREECA